MEGSVYANSSLFLLFLLQFCQLAVVGTELRVDGIGYLLQLGTSVNPMGDGLLFFGWPGGYPRTQCHRDGCGTSHENKRVVPKSQRLQRSNIASVEPGRWPNPTRNCLFFGERDIWTTTLLTVLNNFGSSGSCFWNLWV